jgi:hypothetical protein
MVFLCDLLVGVGVKLLIVGCVAMGTVGLCSPFMIFGFGSGVGF